MQRKSELELVVSRSVNAPARVVFEAWTDPELLEQWWVPMSSGVVIILCELDVRTGGAYRLEFGHPSSSRVVSVFGRYVEVVRNSRLVWTNEECGDRGALTTVTFEERAGTTLITVHDRYPSIEALEDAVSSGTTSGWSEQFEQLDDLLETGRP